MHHSAEGEFFWDGGKYGGERLFIGYVHNGGDCCTLAQLLLIRECSLSLQAAFQFRDGR